MSNQTVSATTGLLLTLPSAIFIFISVTKFQFGIPVFYDGTMSIMQATGLTNSPEWVLNSLVIGCPLAALLLNISSMVSCSYHLSKSDIIFHFSVKRNKRSAAIIMVSSFCLLVLFLYVLTENCNCN